MTSAGHRRRRARAEAMALADARHALPVAYQRGRVRRAGGISRSDALWDLIVADRASERRGASGLFVVVATLHPRRHPGAGGLRLRAG